MTLLSNTGTNLSGNRNMLLILMGLVAMLLSACGNDAGKSSNASAPPAATSSSASASSSGKTVTASEHQQFEQTYSEQCIKAQHPDENSQMRGDQATVKICECIAKTISARLSKADAVHFLKKHEFPIDMVMMTEAASNTCYSSVQ